MDAPKQPARQLAGSGFAGDTGEAASEVTAALASYAQGATRYADALAAVQSSRLLVPVVALLGEVEYDEQGLARDKTSDMAAVLLTGNDGRLALLAFTSTTAMKTWNPDARPVPVTAQVAAQSALHDSAAALLIDVAGPVSLVVEGADLAGLAGGWRLAEIGGHATWIRPEDR